MLDRDGVINIESSSFIRHPDEWQPLPGSLAAIASLQPYFDFAVCTNQSGVGRGLFDEDTLAAIHAKMNRLLTAAGGKKIPVFYCPHHPDDGCDCRKPAPGLLHLAIQHYAQTPQKTVFVGDSKRDLLAAAAAGCQPVLVMTGNGADTRQQNPDVDFMVYDDLQAFCAARLRDTG